MGETNLQRSIRERQRAARRAVGAELKRVRLESGLSLRALGAAIGMDASHLSRVESGEHEISHPALVAAAAALGHDVSSKLFPSSGPRVRDHIQARMIEALLRVAHSRWEPRLEVAVYRPVHGVIDVTLQDRTTGDVVSGESHSQLAAVDAQLRWAAQKTDALASATGWPWHSPAASLRVSRLLLLRSTETNRNLVRQLRHTFLTAYPEPPASAWTALTTDTGRWPGDAMLRVDVRGSDSRVLHQAPRGLDTIT